MNSDSEKPLAGRIALVTGATRGIGEAIAVGLAKAGAHVIALGRTQGALEALDDTIFAATGEHATLVPLDLREAERQRAAELAIVNTVQQALAGELNIRSIPTLMVFKDGQLAATKVGDFEIKGLPANAPLPAVLPKADLITRTSDRDTVVAV